MKVFQKTGRFQGWLLKYKWYKDWCANRSRKSLEKRSSFNYKEDNRVEQYQPEGAIMQREAIRRIAIEAERERRAIEEAKGDDIWDAMEKEKGALYIAMNHEEQSAFWLEYQKRRYV